MDEQWQQLQSLLEQLLEAHRVLHERVKQKMQAMRGAKPTLIEQACHAENEAVQQIAVLEKQRQNCVAELVQSLNMPNDRMPSLSEIIAHAPHNHAGQMTRTQRDLQQVIGEIRHEIRVASQASRGLLGHLRMVIEGVVKSVSKTGTYGRKGLAPHETPISTLSVTG